MSLIVLAIIVLVLAALAIYAIDRSPLTQPFNWILIILVVLVAILVIGQRAGLF